MNDPDNFLSRWSRRKREGDTDRSRPQNSGEQANPIPRNEQPVEKDDAGAPSEFDLASLPSIDSIGAGTDISAFMKKGVPSALRHAALRRAWSADPAIRDFMGPTENYWDAVGPDGIPGFGDLDPGLDVKRMVSELFGEPTSDKRDPDENDVANAPAQREENFEVTDDHNQAADRAQQSAPQQSEYVAMQKQPAEEPAKQKMTHRHGSAMPE
jgi:uncharacterized protein DUF3306